MVSPIVAKIGLSMLERVVGIVKERREVYGSPFDQHDIAANMFNAWKGTNLTAADVTMMMVIIKQSRLAQTPDHEDSIADIAGYADVYHEVINGMKEKGKDFISRTTGLVKNRLFSNDEGVADDALFKNDL